MIIFPAMDLRCGKCVRLYQGEFSTSQVVGQEPLSTALEFKNLGAEYLHMVDLDGAFEGNVKNLEIVKKVIEETRLPLQLGGGIRDICTIEKLIDIGIERVILGTAALNTPSLVEEAVKKYGDKIAVGIDAKNGYAAVEGWIKVSKINYLELGKRMEDMGVKTIIFTDINRDGTLKGPDFDSTGLLNEQVSCNIIASGGVHDIEDIEKLARMNLFGAIVGKALYNGNIDLKEAIKVGRGA